MNICFKKISSQHLSDLGRAESSSCTRPNTASVGSAALLFPPDFFVPPEAAPESSPAVVFLLLLDFSLLPPRVPVRLDLESFSRLLSFSFLPKNIMFFRKINLTKPVFNLNVQVFYLCSLNKRNSFSKRGQKQKRFTRKRMWFFF